MISRKARDIRLYEAWRLAVLARDDYRCTRCGNASERELYVEHLEPCRLASEACFELANGVTFCKVCASVASGTVVMLD